MTLIPYLFDSTDKLIVIFLLAGAVIVYAVYTNAKRPGPPLPKVPMMNDMPPPRPSMDEEA